jgi:quercetin dioxygenase-like cupin family protein
MILDRRKGWSMVKRHLTVGGIVASIFVLLAGAAVATPGSGTAATVVARAAFADRVDLKLSIKDDRRGRDNIHVRDAEDTVLQQIVFAANGTSGWHSHHGPAVILIKSGQLTFYSEDDPGCIGRTFTAGQAFVEPPNLVHFARNESPSEIAEVGVTYLDVPPGASPRVDEPAPGNCPF